MVRVYCALVSCSNHLLHALHVAMKAVLQCVHMCSKGRVNAASVMKYVLLFVNTKMSSLGKLGTLWLFIMTNDVYVLY